MNERNVVDFKMEKKKIMRKVNLLEREKRGEIKSKEMVCQRVGKQLTTLKEGDYIGN